jgi:hypothetical protein
LYSRLATELEDAGIRTLLTDSKVPIPDPTRAAMLNDYGFWLSRTQDPRAAIPVLQRVTTLAPSRGVAQLNLADAARDGMGVAATWDEKRTLAKVGLGAYAAYKKITGKDASTAREFEALHRAPPAEVCSYVAEFYNRGREREMWGVPDPVDIAGDGKLRHVYIYHGGTAHVPDIVASTDRLDLDDYGGQIIASEREEVKFSPSDQEDRMWLAEPHVMPFKTNYYVVYESDDGPLFVVKPNAGTVCRFNRSFTPILTEDHAPAICRQAIAGVNFPEVPRQQQLPDPLKLSSERLDLVHTDSQWISFENYSDLKVGNESLRLGHFEIASGAGRGCDLKGVALLKSNELDQSPRARALIEVQRKMTNCHGSHASVVRIEGESFIEVDGGEALQRTIPPRILLRLRGNEVETVCRVEQKPRYEAQPSGKP